MNQRMRELAEQAGYPDYMTYGQDRILEYFAELIVRECAEQICEDPYYAGEAAKYIKEHFGVE